jgi:hypothetical protein
MVIRELNGAYSRRTYSTDAMEGSKFVQGLDPTPSSSEMASMAPVLPSSISPHVATLLSPDLVELLASSELPPLCHVLQSYSPLPASTSTAPDIPTNN